MEDCYKDAYSEEQDFRSEMLEDLQREAQDAMQHEAQSIKGWIIS